MGRCSILVVVFSALVVACSLLLVPCAGTTYTVGGLTGWDISADLNSWASSNTFKTDDVLSFSYSSYHNLEEVSNEDDYNSCNSSNPIFTSKAGNNSLPLTEPGSRYFICGVKLHCLGGMKMRIVTLGGGTAGTTNGTSSQYGSPNLESGQNLPPYDAFSSAYRLGAFRYGSAWEHVLVALCSLLLMFVNLCM